jgi:phage repressor protein C with HTH and peptisase S24 domain
VPIAGSAITSLAAKFGATEADVYLVSVTGESMAPLICDGDVILVDRRDRDLRRDDVYVIRMDDALLVKNVQVLPGGAVRIWSENDKISAPFTVNVHDQALAPGYEVIGRVLWRGGTLRR